MKLKEITHLEIKRLRKFWSDTFLFWSYDRYWKIDHLTEVGAGTMHGFGTDPIRNLAIWLVENQNQVN